MSENIDTLANKLIVLKEIQNILYNEHRKIFMIGGYCDRLYNNGYIDGNQFYINKYNCECLPEIKSLIDKMLLNNREIKSVSKSIDDIYDAERRKILIKY